MKHIMLLGDSVRSFYQQKTIEKLGAGYRVWGPTENCRFAKYTFNSLRFYLADFPTPDVIHWNNGLWDTAILYPEDGCFTPLDEYMTYMQRILRELQKTGARIIFATTTPVGEEKRFWPGPMPPAHANGDILRYNAACVRLMEENGVVVNDLHRVMCEGGAAYLRDDLIHPSPAGVEALSDAVSACIARVARDVPEREETDAVHAVLRDEKTIQ